MPSKVLPPGVCLVDVTHKNRVLKPKFLAGGRTTRRINISCPPPLLLPHFMGIFGGISNSYLPISREPTSLPSLSPYSSFCFVSLSPTRPLGNVYFSPLSLSLILRSIFAVYKQPPFILSTALTLVLVYNGRTIQKVYNKELSFVSTKSLLSFPSTKVKLYFIYLYTLLSIYCSNTLFRLQE